MEYSIIMSKKCFLVLFLLLVSTSTYSSTNCKQVTTKKQWVEALKYNADAQNNYYKDLKTCLNGNGEYQDLINQYSVATLDFTETKLTESHTIFITHIERSLLLSAQAGHAPSMHNYAALFNAQPGSKLSANLPQNYKTFMAWTIKAARKAEPRSIFNLAMRLTYGVPEEGYPANPYTAYQLLAFLENNKPSSSTTMEQKLQYLGMTTHIKNAKAINEKKLGNELTSDIDASISKISIETILKDI